jgi:hypothetical protein
MAAEIVASFLEMSAGGAERFEGVADLGVGLRGRDGGGGGVGRRDRRRAWNEYKSDGKNREAE